MSIDSQQHRGNKEVVAGTSSVLSGRYGLHCCFCVCLVGFGVFSESWRLGKIVDCVSFLVFLFVSLTRVLIKQVMFLFVLDVASSILREEFLFSVCLFPTEFQLKPVFLYVRVFNRSC